MLATAIIALSASVALLVTVGVIQERAISKLEKRMNDLETKFDFEEWIEL